MSLVVVLEDEAFLKLKLSGDVKRLCRVCLNNTTDMHSIFELKYWMFQDKLFQFNIIQYLKKSFNINIRKQDGWPHMLCEGCLAQVTSTYVLTQQFEETQRILTKYFDEKPLITSNTSINPIIQQIIEKIPVSCGNILKNSQTNSCILKNQQKEDKTIEPSDIVKKNDSPLLEADNIITGDINTDGVYFEDTDDEYGKTEVLIAGDDNRNAENRNNVNNGSDSKKAVHNQGISEVYLFDEDDKILGDRIFKCGICQYTATSFKTLTQHRKNHGTKIYQCTICDVGFSIFSALRRHRHVHAIVKKMLGIFQCSLCADSYVNERSFRVHKRNHEITASDIYQCHTCDRKYRKKCHLVNHLKSQSCERLHVCDTCGKCFAQKNMLTAHRRTHDDSASNKMLVCKRCGKEFTTSVGLTMHSLTHSGLVLKCSICPFKFVQMRTLNRHMKIAHAKSVDS